MRELNLHWNLIIVLAVAAGLRFYNLGQIPGPIFDEVFYPLFAINYLNGENFFSVHPPLGSYLITLSVFIFDIFPLAESLQIKTGAIEDINPISFRWLVALCGVCLVYVGYRLSLELLNNKLFAGLTALFFCIDGSLLVDSRLGLINVFLTLFGFISLLCFVRAMKLMNKRYIILSGLALGAAFSVKWNGLGFWLLLILFCLQMILIQKILDSADSSEQRLLKLNFRSLLLIFLLPFLTYLFLWIPELLHNQRSLVDQHLQMYSYHFENTEDKVHPYSSPWYTWPLMIRPIGYYFNSEYLIVDGVGFDIFQAIHLFPNPALNIFSVVAIFLLTLKWFESIAKSLGNKEIDGDLIIISIICIGFYANFLPWAIASRSTFIHHFQPSACFAFMALAFLLFKASNKNKFENRGFVLSILVLIIISTIYWLPLQLGIPISSESFYSRMWFESWI